MPESFTALVRRAAALNALLNPMTAMEQVPPKALKPAPLQNGTPLKPTVMIATPFKDLPEDATQAEQVDYLNKYAPQIGQTLKELISMPEGARYVWEFMGVVGGLCRARNSAVHEFLKSGFNWLLWWDRDLWPDKPAEAVLRLLSHHQPIVGGIFCKRAAGKKPVWAVTWIPKCEPQKDLPGLIQVAELAGGFKLIHRRAFLTVAGAFKPRKDYPGIQYRDRDTGEMVQGFYQNLVVDGDLLSEDYWFDYLCRCSNIGILADTQIRLRHRDVHSNEVKWYPDNRFPPIPGMEDAS
jgi:hypothetical protein